MVYDIRLNPVKEILVRYIYQAADITMISSLSGLDQGSIAAGGAAVNYCQAVLERACLEGAPKVDAVLDRAKHHLKGTVAEAPLRAVGREVPAGSRLTARREGARMVKAASACLARITPVTGVSCKQA